jgi:hypothetical protein
MPLPRMTTRRWMIAVAVVAVLVGWLFERQARFARFAAYYKEHRFDSIESYDKPNGLVGLRARIPNGIKLSSWRSSLARKYNYAARHPWLLVPPDPPEPK